MKSTQVEKEVKQSDRAVGNVECRQAISTLFPMLELDANGKNRFGLGDDIIAITQGKIKEFVKKLK